MDFKKAAGAYVNALAEDISALCRINSVESEAKPGMQILDACAAPGGKSALLCEAMNGTGRVYAWDLHEHRVSLIRATARRLELDNLRRVEGELEWFTLKFDYRNDGKPWGNSQDAPERAINKLMGACVGAEAEMPAHND